MQRRAIGSPSIQLEAMRSGAGMNTPCGHSFSPIDASYITWWDMLFGTYENPKEWVHTCGFDDAKEQRLVDMLLYKDAHDEP